MWRGSGCEVPMIPAVHMVAVSATPTASSGSCAGAFPPDLYGDRDLELTPGGWSLDDQRESSIWGS
ncbi:hypothetical protein FA13DRAFT_1742579 [Coprinellus micaceus]|uniref:Uncharacterized protein n=1 Tax=Coprinellus micaceus TaxID=71717 RepID=A0A4Y7SGQ3_COPMI|nr:hypothetical protein FA13DRAFT_1742579 [Coprinellus micaceus]